MKSYFPISKIRNRNNCLFSYCLLGILLGQKRLKLLLKKHPKFKRKVKNVDKLSPTKLEKTYF